MKKLLLTIGIGFSIFSQSQNLLTNLQGCYPFDCDPVSNSVTPNNVMANNPSLNGTVHNLTCTAGHNNAANSAFYFPGSGSSYIELPNSPLLKPQAISVSGWYNASSSTTGQYLVWTDNGASSNFEAYALYINAGSFTVVKHTNSSGGSSATAGGVAPNTWYHVVFTIDNSFIKIYVNGVLVNSNPAINPFNYSAIGKVYLGGTAFSGAQNNHNAPFQGTMDNIRFYNRVISAGEVDTLFRFDPLCSAASVTTVPTPTGTSGCCLGNYCGSPINGLANNYQIKTNGFNFNFTDDGPTRDKVNVGFPCGTSSFARLNAQTLVQTNSSPVFGLSPHSVGIHGASKLANANMHNVGVMGDAENFNQNVLVYGVWGRAKADGGDGVGVRGSSEWNGSHNNYGGSFFASNADFYNIGVSGQSLPSNNNPAPMNYAVSYPSGAKIGVYGACTPFSTSNTPPYSTIPTNEYAAWFDGDINIVGNAYCSYTTWSSDRRFKSNIKEIENVSEKLAKLKGYSYNFKTSEFKHRNFPAGEQLGFIAQELNEVFPQLVTDDKQGYLSVNYIGFIPVLLQAHQEQQIKIEEQAVAIKNQQEQIDELKVMLQSLSGAAGKTSSNKSNQNVKLGDRNTIVLNQNVPNPFAENTVITYNIPGDFTKAEILFTTNDGVIIKTVQITEKGEGSVNVFANDLSHGVYTYTLVIDGKSIDSKKMIKE